METIKRRVAVLYAFLVVVAVTHTLSMLFTGPALFVVYGRIVGQPVLGGWELDGVDMSNPEIHLGTLILAILPRLIQSVLVLWGCWQARKLLEGYRTGPVFTGDSVHRLTQMGKALFFYGLMPIQTAELIGPSVRVLFSLQWELVALGLFVSLMSQIQGEALRLQQEQDLVI